MAKSTAVMVGGSGSRRDGVPETKRQRLFYAVFLPVGLVVNLGLGIFILIGLNPASWSDWLQIATGALCCVIAGWLGSAAWSKFYWYRSMSRQVATWGRIADAFFAWVEEAPVPAEALNNLKSSLEEAVPTAQSR